MDYTKGEKALLYTEFKYNNELVEVTNPQVRILHEVDDKVYEDLPWQNMTKFDNGYIYKFDTNNCDNYGTYVIVYQGFYNENKLNLLDKFNLIVSNTNDINGVKIYGYINDINSNRILTEVKVKIIDLNINEIVYQTIADEDGMWECHILPGDYDFIFTKDGYEDRDVRAQVGDENSEVQFNNIALEKISDKDLGNGLYRIDDSFTKKDKTGIADITLKIFNIEDMDNVLLTLTTDVKGKWTAFLDEGIYIVKLNTPSGTEKMFKMKVTNDGNHTLEEYTINVATTNVSSGEGSEEVTDFIVNAQGNGISNVNINVFSYNDTTSEYDTLIATNTTDDEGKFTFKLDKGKYKFVITADNYKTQEQIINV